VGACTWERARVPVSGNIITSLSPKSREYAVKRYRWVKGCIMNTPICLLGIRKAKLWIRRVKLHTAPHTHTHTHSHTHTCVHAHRPKHRRAHECQDILKPGELILPSLAESLASSRDLLTSGRSGRAHRDVTTNSWLRQSDVRESFCSFLRSKLEKKAPSDESV